MLATRIVENLPAASFAADRPEEPLSLPEAIDTARQLTAVLDEEMKLLRSLDIAEMRELTDEKSRLTASWSEKAARLRNEPGFIDSVEPRLRDEFLEVMEALQTTAQANAGALRAALFAHDRLFRAITAAAREQCGAETPAGYAERGERAALSPLATAGLAFDRNL